MKRQSGSLGKIQVSISGKVKTHGSRVWVEDSYSKRNARAEGEQKGKKKFLFIHGTKAETNNHGYGDAFCVLVYAFWASSENSVPL